MTIAERGSHNDQYLVHASAIEDIMRMTPFSTYYLYADAGYNMAAHIIVPFKGNLSLEQATFNTSMSAVRISVENGFSRIRGLWRFLNNDDELMLLKMPLSTMYRVATLLTNVRTILDGGNQVSAMFDFTPPSLSDYLATAFM